MAINRNQIWTEEHERQLRDLAETGVSASRAAARMKRSRSAVISKGQRLGVKFQTPQRIGSNEPALQQAR